MSVKHKCTGITKLYQYLPSI